jgi:cytidine deaminase
MFTTDDLPPALTRATTAAVETLDSHDGSDSRAAAAVATPETVHTGLHLDTTISTAAVHAEPVAVADAVETHGDPEILACAAVSRPEADAPPEPIPPCGVCRELLADYAADATVLVPGAAARPLSALLPMDVSEITPYPRFDDG